MRIPALALSTALLCACAGRDPARSAEPPDEAWQEFVRGELLAVRIERRLYEAAGNPHFLIRVRLINRTNAALGVDLRDGMHVFFPNQWGGLSEPARGIIDEAYPEPLPLTDERKARLIRDLGAGALSRIPPGAALDYFREFNASGRARIDAADAPYLFVSVKGQLFATDGARAENLLPPEEFDAVILTMPVAWSDVPDDALVVPDPWSGRRRAAPR